jgi:hypothetical protein
MHLLNSPVTSRSSVMGQDISQVYDVGTQAREARQHYRLELEVLHQSRLSQIDAQNPEKSDKLRQDRMPPRDMTTNKGRFSQLGRHHPSIDPSLLRSETGNPEQPVRSLLETTMLRHQLLSTAIQIDERAWRRLKENSSLTTGCHYMHQRL